MDKLYYGAAYYEEYLPYDRLEKDVQMMKAAGINVVRIAESTWSTCEPQPGVFDFSHVTRVLDAMEEAGIHVIIGTPTYAVPTWMVKAHPEVLAVTKDGNGIYGARQIMDITNPTYLFYAKRVIEKLMECTAHRACVIGFQLDNETKYYGTAGTNVQQEFIKYLREKFKDDLDALNQAFGFDYWSNRINAWEDFPDVRGTINGSFGAEFAKFQRILVTRFLSWQAQIVSQYKREDQFLTQNFDFEWRGYSYGIQPYVDVDQAAKQLTIAGVDIYHPSQDVLTGAEIAFGGDVARSIKKGNYLVLETQAQGFPDWLPFKGQLLLQAYSHIANGASSVMYWHWHSLHNAIETYWKGLLSHDFMENDTYCEAKQIGAEFHRLSDHLVHLKKRNKVAILVSNTSLTALEWFPIDASPASAGATKYNDIVRYVYDACFELNLECDFIWDNDLSQLSSYALVLVPAFYAASEDALNKLKVYTAEGGHLFVTFKSAFTDENLKVYHDSQPHILSEVCGITYNQFSTPGRTKIKSEYFKWEDEQAELFMELVRADTAKVLASYDHESFLEYAAVTQNVYGKGMATYLSCKISKVALKTLLKDMIRDLEIEKSSYEHPVIVRKAWNDKGHLVTFYLNYSRESVEIVHTGAKAVELRENKAVQKGERILLKPWDVWICEES